MTWVLSPFARKSLAQVTRGEYPWVTFEADCLDVLPNIERGTVTLAYLDPPFCTQEAFSTTSGEPAFDDRWQGGFEEYIQALQRRIKHIYRTLAPHGSIVVHVDPRVSHHVRTWLDFHFGAQCFASEIVWRYRRWPSKTPNFQRVHDVLIRYTKTQPHVMKPRFNQLYEPLAESTRASFGTRKQKAVTTSGKRRTSTTDEQSLGVPLGDVWTDIGVIAPSSKERNGYPTQKPERLLERLVLSLTNPGDLVLDPYMGSGTTIATAVRLGRRAIGIDKSPTAISVMSERMRGVNGPV